MSERHPLRAVLETDAGRWNEALLSLPYNHALQTFEWGTVKSRHGWTASPLLFLERERTRAAALVLRRKLPHLPWSVLYVPKGPALDYGDGHVLGGVLAELEQRARRDGAILVKIDPDVCRDDSDDDLGAIQAEIAAPASAAHASTVIRTLTGRGWRHSDEQIQFPNTAVLSLQGGEDALLAQMKSKTRYNIRLATRKGVTVRRGGPEDMEQFYGLYAQTAERDGFIIRPFEYYRDAWGTFLQDGLAAMLLAESEGTVLAGLILFLFGRKAWYMYGASASQDRHLMPNYLLQWEAIRLCRERGCTVYDLWGAPNEEDEADALWGVYRFKQGLGGRLVRHIGAYDFPARRSLYFLFQTMLPRYLAILRRRHHAAELSG